MNKIVVLMLIILIIGGLLVMVYYTIVNIKEIRYYGNLIKWSKRDTLWDALICDCDKCEFVEEKNYYDEWKYGPYRVLVWKPKTLRDGNYNINKDYAATLHYDDKCILSYYNTTKSEILAENLNFIKAGLAR